jgi:hypothetical protein
MAHPFELKERAITLRKEGCSLKEISEALHIVKSTASLWVKDVVLCESARDCLFAKTKYWHFFNAEKRKEQTKALEGKYLKEALDQIKADPDFDKIMCAMIYWCEGSKSPRGVAFTNSDPNLVRTFLKLLRKSFVLDESKFAPCIHLHAYHSAKRQLDFWSKITDIDKRQFVRPYQKPNTGKRKRENYEGCISVRYYSADLARRLMAVAKAYLQDMGV